MVKAVRLEIRRYAAMLYAGISVVVVAFQVALAIGVPWGAYAMGGAFPGRLPTALRGAAIVQALVLLALAAVVLARQGVAFGRLAGPSRRLIWVVAVLTALSLTLNVISPSAGERAIWVPIVLALLITSLLVATGRR